MSFYCENCEERGEDAERLVDILTAERDALTARLAEAIATLQSIASNTCCGGCNEAALVARAFLAPAEPKHQTPENTADSASLNMEPCPDGSRVLCVADQPDDAPTP